MFERHLCHLTYDHRAATITSVPETCTSSASSIVSSGSSASSNSSQMGNCALCEDKLRRESEENEPLVEDQTTVNFPSSYSYPLFCNHTEFRPNYHEPAPYQRTVAKSYSLSSICTPGFKPNFSPSYLDCRLRYIRQTRRIQKHLRITPEGHLLVNDVKQYARRHSNNNYCSGDQINSNNSCSNNNNNNGNNVDCETFHPVSALISVSKLRRIHAAYWNLESRQDLLRSRSATIHELNSISESKTTTPSPQDSLTQDGSNADVGHGD